MSMNSSMESRFQHTMSHVAPKVPADDAMPSRAFSVVELVEVRMA